LNPAFGVRNGAEDSGAEVRVGSQRLPHLRNAEGQVVCPGDGNDEAPALARGDHVDCCKLSDLFEADVEMFRGGKIDQLILELIE